MFHFPGAHHHQTFEATYRAFPLAFIDKQSADYGDKVILPPSALHRLASLEIEYPMLFKVSNRATGRHTHCGVLEFIAQEGHVYLPRWMMGNMLLTEGQPVTFTNVSLPKGSFVKLQPVTSDFLDISNPKAVLERTLRSYSCLTVGDCFVVNYNNKDYEIEVREVKPGTEISIIETDVNLEFEAPKDYKEPVPQPAAMRPAAAMGAAAAAGGMQPLGGAAAGGQPGSSTAGEGAAEEEPEEPKFVAFQGSGRRLDGKAASSSSSPAGAAAANGRSPAAAAAAARAAAAGAGSSSGGGGSSGAVGGAKPGTFVSTGNRLLDKLEMDKLKAKGQLPASAAPKAAGAAADGADGSKEEEEPNFKPFAGKGYSLRG